MKTSKRILLKIDGALGARIIIAQIVRPEMRGEGGGGACVLPRFLLSLFT